MIPHEDPQPNKRRCASPDCCSSVDRRQFLKTAGLGVVGASSLADSLSLMAGPGNVFAPVAEHLVPAEKKLSPTWIRSLFERGEAEVYRGADLDTIGMPVGGIAAGQLYLRGDGTLGSWQIFNRRHFSGYGAKNYEHRTPDSPVEQGFAVRLKQGAKTVTRKLDRHGWSVVEFDGRYPVGRVRYRSEGCPLKVEMEAFSPFVPLATADSTLPATLFHITLENASTEGVQAGLLAWLENAVCFHSASEVAGLRRSRIVEDKGRTLLIHSAEELPQKEKPRRREKVVLADFEGEDYGKWTVSGEAPGRKPARGTLANQQKVSGFLGKQLVNTYLGGDGPQGTLTSPPFVISRKFVNFLLGGGGHENETCIRLLVDGKAVRTATGRSDERLTWRSWNVAELEGREASIEIVDRHSGAWGHINVDQIELDDERRGGPSGPIDKLEDYGTMTLAFRGQAAAQKGAWDLLASLDGLESGIERKVDTTYPMAARRAAALLTPDVQLAPGEKHRFTFVITWHFPNHQNGHEYVGRFASATRVADYVLDHHDRLSADTLKWYDTYYGGTLPQWLLFRLHSTVANLATGTCQWWGNGRFWAWEGVGCCHGTCTHVWNYAHALARLFPDLERSAREMQDLSAAFHPNGLVGFRGEQNGSYAADGQAGTVLKCYREHLTAPDDRFLKRNWPRIRKVLEYSILRDGNADGLIEDSQHNTFDINFEGPNTFVGSLYLAALRAGEEMAREVGDTAFAERVHRIFLSGSRLSTEKLWNGEYFVQLVDLEKHPRFQYKDGCLSDQLFGQGWAYQLALGSIYPEENCRKALQSVWKYNWAPDIGPYNAAHKPERWFASPREAGLFTCTWPTSEYLSQGVRYRSEVWTGIEYQVAGHMVWEGLLTEALAIVRAVHDRYHPRKHNPFNEVECGDHYARALASWGVFTALSGYEYHGPRSHIGFSPRLTPEDFRAAFTAAEGWGTFSQTRRGERQKDRIEVAWGKLRLETLAFTLPKIVESVRVTVTARGKPLEFTHSLEGARLSIKLAERATLKAGEALEVGVG